MSLSDKDYPDEPKYDKKGYSDFIRKQLEDRRAFDNDSMWRKVGIKYMGDKKQWKHMYGWEIQYYRNHWGSESKTKKSRTKLRGKR